ncbi:MAG: phosphoenolpyruvate--protein phosphotransferase [Planctomycetes bacterium]|nr:phosphoenolpyruvate--protein phosphotransferase [Planctomycetota bacterium]
MQQLEGIAVSPGLVIGEALIIDNEGFRIPHHLVVPQAAEGELRRFREALAAVADDIRANCDSVTRQLGPQYGAIFAAHLQLLADPRLREEVERRILDERYSAEYAVSRTLRGYADHFLKFENAYLAERVHDLYDLERRLLQSLTGRQREELRNLDSAVVVLAHNLTPSETANLNRRYVVGFATEIGGAGGHTAIVAQGMEIPAVVGIGRFLADVSGGDTVIVDGDKGRLILRPDEPTLTHYQKLLEEHRAAEARRRRIRDLPAETRDGTRVFLLANIEFPHETSACLERGADGIGLYRTEFLYAGASAEPTEEDHYQAYAQVVHVMEGHPVVIRTLDLGADKMGLGPQLGEEDRNPFLGLRSIRLALSNLQLFKPQLRAILRASILGDVRVMFPLISTLDELRRAKQVVVDAMEELQAEGVSFNRDIPIGMMVESPAAALMIDHFVNEIQFLSIGTNDLIQYTLAVDRGNPAVNDLYQASDPAVLRLIERTVRTADEAHVEAGLCGQMSSEPIYVMLLLGLGLRRLSVAPSSIPEIKEICRSVTISQCQAVAARAMTMQHPRDIDAFLEAELRKVMSAGDNGR